MTSNRVHLRRLLYDDKKEKALAKRFEETIRKWVAITIEPDFFSYGGGVSGAKVHNLGFGLHFPGTTLDPVNGRVVVKLDSKKSLRIDQNKYDQLNELKEIQKYFVRFSSSEKQVNDEFFVVMELLENYDSFEDILYSMESSSAYEPCSAVLDALETIQIDLGGKTKTSRLESLYAFYFGEIEKSIYRILEMRDKRLTEIVFEPQSLSDIDYETAHDISLVDCFEKLMDRRKDLKPAFETRVHGDCHPRNILYSAQGDPQVKFIDIDKFATRGDYIYDYGELLADLEVFGYLKGVHLFPLPANPYKYNLSLSPAVKLAISEVHKRVEKLADDDKSNWKSRLSLSRARYLLSMVPSFESEDFSKIFVTLIEGLKALQHAADEL